MRLIFIYGPPGVGKLTVAKELALLTGFKLWDNHKSIDAVLPVFGFRTEPFIRLRDDLRTLVFAEAAAQDLDLIFTMAYDHPDDIPYVEFLVAPVEQAGGIVQFVQLTCDERTHEERATSFERQSTTKVSDLDLLRRLKQEHELFAAIPGRDSLCIDNTDLSPADAALRIIEHYRLPAVEA
jgi:hypothetical protein